MADRFEPNLSRVCFGIVDEACYHRVEGVFAGKHELLVAFEAIDVAIIVTEQRRSRDSDLVYVTAGVPSDEDSQTALVAASLLIVRRGTLNVLGATTTGIALFVAGPCLWRNPIV